MSRFKLIGGVALLLFSSLFSTNALADGHGVLRCDNCTTVSQFSNTAGSYAEMQSLGVGHYRFVVVNPNAKLLGIIIVTRMVDREGGGYITLKVALTGTVGEMQQDYRAIMPDEGIVDIPTSIANTYTGSNQQSSISTYLSNYFSGSNFAQNVTVLVLFADNSNTVYQLTNAVNNDWTLVSYTGHDPDGNGLDDDGQPFAISPIPSQTVVAPGPVTTGSGVTIKAPDYHTGGGVDAATYFLNSGHFDMYVDGIFYCYFNTCTPAPPPGH
ncbi:MAG: hypothetical protein ACRES9_09110 [Gammaproteobacteria bacterium]